MEYKSCNLLEHGICFYETKLCSCCYTPQGKSQSTPFFYPLYNGEKVSTDLLFSKINRYREYSKNNKYLYPCKDCYKLENRNWSEENYIDQVYITHFKNCNADCIYCITEATAEDKKKKTYNIMPVLNDLRDKGILKEGCEFHIGGGEFSIYRECNDIINTYILSGFTEICAIATNGIAYSEAIFNAMNHNRAVIIISLDCGSERMYKKIKRVNAFNSVINNLRKYTKTKTCRQNTFLKYIILPGINNNRKEFEKFLNIAENFGIQGIKIDIDGKYCSRKNYILDKKDWNYSANIIDYAKNRGFEVETFSFYNQCLAAKC